MSSTAMVRELVEMADAGRNLSRALVRIADDHRTAQVEWFASRGQGTWPSHAGSYAARPSRWRNSPGRGMLERTGTLLRSLTQPGHSSSAVEVGSNDVTVGTHASIAHLVSSGEGRAALPARPVLDLTEETVDRWVDIIDAHLTSQDSGALGFGL